MKRVLSAVLVSAAIAVACGEDTPVGPETLARAICLGEFLASHALAVYRYVGADPVEADAQKVLDWILRKQVERFTVRDVYQCLKGTFRTMSDLRPPLDTLTQLGHIAREKAPRAKTRGRPVSPVLVVNPAIVRGWGA